MNLRSKHLESTNAESLLQIDNSLVALKGAKGAICVESQHTNVSMNSKDGLASKWTFWMLVKFSSSFVKGFLALC